MFSYSDNESDDIKSLEKLQEELQLEGQLRKAILSLCRKIRERNEQLHKKNLKLTAQNKQIKSEKSQLELNYFWDKNKNNYEIWKLYKQFIHYKYEIEGWNVEEATNTLGIYLICQKCNSVHLIQCRNWSQKKTIDDKIISQFDKAIHSYKLKNDINNLQIDGVFYTTTSLSPNARLLATKLNITVHEEYKMPTQFPIVKAINNNKTYYLPTDNGYEDIKLDLSKGDKYFDDTFKAEDAGFHR